jgi:hypothetical protein
MADRDKYVDIFFRNGLKEFEVLPPVDMWTRIQPALGKREKSRTLFRVAAVIAILMSLSALSVWLTKNLSDNFKGLSFSLNQEARPAGSYVAGKVAVNKPAIRVQDKISTSVTPVATEKERGSVPVFIKIPENDLFSLSLNSLRLETDIRPLNVSSEINKSNIVSGNISFNVIPSAAVKNDPEITINRWSISAMASPNYYSNVNFGRDQLANDLANYQKPEVSYSGGMAFAYKVNKRMSIQSGVYYSSIGQKISGISSYSGFSQYNDTKGGSQFSIQTSSGTIVTTNNNIFLRDNLSTRVVAGYVAESVDPVKVSLTHLNNSISQNFSYLEVPVIFKYKAIDRKIDVNFIGGLSYNMLVGNSASASVGGIKYSIGKTDGLSPVNFSSSLGLGFEYNLSKKFSLDLEPTFRYYLTPFGSIVGTSIHPYSFGVFTGVLYKF